MFDASRRIGHHACVSIESVGTSGWFPDPARRHRLRYWDGQEWTAWTSDGDQPILDANWPRAPRALLTVLGIAAVAAMPLAAWWLIGDQSETSLRLRDQLDYIWQAPDVSQTLTSIVGAVALATVAIGVVGYVVAAKRRLIDTRWLLVLAASLIAGALLAAIGRILTAGSVGANIGGGIALLFGLPIVGLLIGYALLQGIGLIVSRRRLRATP